MAFERFTLDGLELLLKHHPISLEGRRFLDAALAAPSRNVQGTTLIREIYHWYEHGLEGKTVGIKEIIKHLNRRGLLMRGHPWRIQKLHDILSSRAYLGEHLFNVRDSKSGKTRPAAEWITVTSDPIIDVLTFERVRMLREQRSPAKTPPRISCCPTLLTGIVSCECGAAMTQATGKSGKYHYYKCSARMSKAGTACRSRNLPMEKFDHLILDAIAERIFSPDRLNVMMAELRKTVRDSQEIGQEQVNELNRQIKAAESRLNNLYDAVEKGLLPMDETLKKTGRPAANGKGCVARRVSKSAPRNVVTSGASVAEHG